MFNQKRMINYFSIHLKAVNKVHNIARQYDIFVGRDLFDGWVITTQFGRIGKSSQSKRYSFGDLEQLKSKLSGVLRKRLNAKRRIGCDYKIIKQSNDPIISELVENLMAG